MNKIKNPLYIFGLLYLATASVVYGEISTNGLASCGGLFLLDSDSKDLSGKFCSMADTMRAGKYTVFAGLSHYWVDGLWKDGWTLSLNSSQTVGNAGIQADFRNIAFSVSASSRPSLTSGITAHAADSVFYASAVLERGAPELTHIRWESENESDEVNQIDALWEAEYLRKGFGIGSTYKGNEILANLTLITTSPQNLDREYFVKDSSRLWIWDARYSHRFTQGLFELYYAGISADSRLYGIASRDNSRKRFMYIPLEGLLHYGDVRWKSESYGLQARGLKSSIRLDKSHDRFFETLAPNRLLPASITQALSFSFLQQNYLVDADLDIAAFSFGGHYSPSIGITPSTRFVPKVEIHGYYTYNELDIDRISETSTFIAYSAIDEHWHWSLESLGAIAGAGISIEKRFRDVHRAISLEWNATQIIPFKTDIIKHSNSDKAEQNAESASAEMARKKDSAGPRSSGIFRNGFATHLGVSIQF